METKYSPISRVGVNVIGNVNLEKYENDFPIGWYKNFCNLGMPVRVGGRELEYVPILAHQGRNNRFPKKNILEMLLKGGMISGNPEDFRNKVFFDALEKRLETIPLPENSLFLIGIEPGYRFNNDKRSPREVVKDAQKLKSIVQNANPTYQIGLGGISTPRNKVSYFAYGMKHGFDFLRRVLDLSGVNLFDSFVIHPYPTDIANPSLEDLSQQVITFRRMMKQFGLRERDLIVGETGLPFGGVNLDDVKEYARKSIEFYLTGNDTDLGNPGDENRLVQRFCWMSFDRPTEPIPGFTDNPQLNFCISTLIDEEGRKTELGNTFCETVEKFI